MARGGKKKPNAYMSYAIHHKAKYEKRARGRQLSAPDLVGMAKDDWDSEPDRVKDFWKSVAKGERSSNEHDTFFRHETSSQRLETEAPVMTDCSLGTLKERQNQEHVQSAAQQFRTRVQNMSEQELLNQDIGILDIVTYVNYKDGYHLPAEIGIVKTSLQDGMTPANEYTALLQIGSFYLSKKPGFGFDAKESAERVHGIDVYKEEDKVPLHSMFSDLDRELTEGVVWLVRLEDVNKVLGSWAWLQHFGGLEHDITVLTIEDFIVTLAEKFPNKVLPTRSQVTQFLAKPEYDTEPTFRCAFHNTDVASDKHGCALKNAKKYFCLVCDLVSGFVELNRRNGGHYYSPPMNKQRAARNRGRGRARSVNSSGSAGSSPGDHGVQVDSEERTGPILCRPARGAACSYSSRGSKSSSPLRPGSPRSYSSYSSRPESPRFSDSNSPSPGVPRKPRHEHSYDKKKAPQPAVNSFISAGAANPKINPNLQQGAPKPRRPNLAQKTTGDKVSQLSYDTQPRPQPIRAQDNKVSQLSSDTQPRPQALVKTYDTDKTNTHHVTKHPVPQNHAPQSRPPPLVKINSNPDPKDGPPPLVPRDGPPPLVPRDGPPPLVPVLCQVHKIPPPPGFGYVSEQ